MNIILIVVFYTLTASGTFTKSEIHKPMPSVVVCEHIAARLLTDKKLNTKNSYVYSADCKKG